MSRRPARAEVETPTVYSSKSLGTVRSRISRGIAQLKQFILAGTCRGTSEDA